MTKQKRQKKKGVQTMDRNSEYRRRFGYDKENTKLYGEQEGDYLRSQAMQAGDHIPDEHNTVRPERQERLNGNKLTSGQKVLIGVGIGLYFLLPILFMVILVFALILFIPSTEYLDDYDDGKNYLSDEPGCDGNTSKSESRDWGTAFSDDDKDSDEDSKEDSEEDDGKAHLTFGDDAKSSIQKRAEEHRRNSSSREGTLRKDYTITYDANGDRLDGSL